MEGLIMKMVNKKLLVGILTLMMSVGMVSIQADATTIITDVHYTSTAGYTFHIRESGSTTELGTMYLTKDSKNVYNTFTASKYCESVTAYVSGTNSGFKDFTVSKISAKYSFTVTKSVDKPTIVYGKCSVTY
ncbi:MAG: hypothetical protein HDT40_09505 [Lachnospiraceae bacterium]|nr:hypothetical protein [Lachnospiraceae bacterium]